MFVLSNAEDAGACREIGSEGNDKILPFILLWRLDLITVQNCSYHELDGTFPKVPATPKWMKHFQKFQSPGPR